MDLWLAILSVPVVFAMACHAEAQDSMLSLAKRTPVPTLTSEIQKTGRQPLPDLDLRIGLELPAWRSVKPERDFTGQVDYRFDARAPGSLVVKYRGLQGFVMKQLQRRFRREWNKTIHELEAETFITDAELTKLRRRQAEAIADHAMGGRWWERDWFLSLPPEKGGIHKGYSIHTVGKKVNVVEWGAFSFNNELRARIDRVALTLSTNETESVFRSPHAGSRAVRNDAMLGREVFEADELAGLDTSRRLPTHRLPGVVDLWIGVEPHGRLLETLSWKLRVRPRARVKVSMRGIKTELRLRATITIYRGVRTKREFAAIRANVRYRPKEGEASASLEVSLLTW